MKTSDIPSDTALPGALRGRLGQLRRWLPVLSFCAGIGSFALLERGETAARWVPLFLVLGWIVQPLIAAVQRRAARLEVLKPELLASAGQLVLQSVQQESFFFALPFVVGATVWDSPSALFAVFVLVAGLLSVIDPVWFGWVARVPWLLTLYHALALFVAALVAIPLLTGTDAVSGLIGAAVLATIFAVPTLFGVREFRRRRAWLLLLGLASVGACVAWFGRALVPPAPLRVVDGVVCRGVDPEKLRPVDVVNALSETDLRSGVVAFTPIRAPLGLEEAIFHEWIHEGRRVDRIRLNIRGGRKEGFRTWSRKRNFPRSPVGRWRVDVVTEYGQLLGRLRFSVVEHESVVQGAAARIHRSAIQETQRVRPVPGRSETVGA